jgi:ppGpp synthetase/RelA/SpoT-type nucleotidyltranferase
MPVLDEVVEELVDARATRYREAEDQLKTHLANLATNGNFLTQAEINSRIGVRIKDTTDIIDKVDRAKPRTVTSLHELENDIVTDIVGGRVVLDYQNQVRDFCQTILTCPHWVVVRNNHGRVHTDTGYRSHHIDVILIQTTSHRAIRCEIQVRSLLQHTYASWSHPVYRRYRVNTKEIPDFLRGQLRQISDTLDGIDKQAVKLHCKIKEICT